MNRREAKKYKFYGPGGEPEQKLEVTAVLGKDSVNPQCLAAKLVPKLVTDRPTEERPATQHDDSSASVSGVLSDMTN
ncbi:hypothetical protein NQ318_009909 [Aromia moschata]|uniref:Uncharacterized protein n=1 Tax=Aromia moschata TaxID=1265417 RepID=A0AAV8YBQ7_9CUCU|nr:hypothetical protein NQ318_009909 [Aromia moschata]